MRFSSRETVRFVKLDFILSESLFGALIPEGDRKRVEGQRD